MSAASAAGFLKMMWDDYESARDRSGRLSSLEYEYIFAAGNGATMAQILEQCSSDRATRAAARSHSSDAPWSDT
jgi:hypothetical protein